MANSENKIILRSVYGKVNQIYYIQPCRDPKTGYFPKDVDEKGNEIEFIKPVDSQNNIIWSDKERDSGGYYMKETEVIKVEDGTTFNLDHPIERRRWLAIKNCPFIAPSRTAKDANGNNLIDGTMGWRNLAPRYGQADLYVYIPDEEANRRISKKDQLRQAMNFIFDDPKGAQGRVLVARLLGRDMSNISDNEVKDWLVSKAEQDPTKIINAYTGDDAALQLFLIKAKEEGVIYVKSGLYRFGETTVLGATENACISFMKNPENKMMVDLMRRQTFPDAYETTTDSNKTSKGKDK